MITALEALGMLCAPSRSGVTFPSCSAPVIGPGRELLSKLVNSKDMATTHENCQLRPQSMRFQIKLVVARTALEV